MNTKWIDTANIGAVFSGILRVDTTGEYVFHFPTYDSGAQGIVSNVNDRAILMIDGVQELDAGDSSSLFGTRAITLETGKDYRIVVHYADSGGWSQISLKWKKKNYYNAHCLFEENKKKECGGAENDQGKITLEECKNICNADNNCQYIDWAAHGGGSDRCIEGITTKCQCWTVNHECSEKVDHEMYNIYKKQSTQCCATYAKNPNICKGSDLAFVEGSATHGVSHTTYSTTRGGGMYVSKFSAARIVGPALIQGNTASGGSGGAVYLDKTTNVMIKHGSTNSKKEQQQEQQQEQEQQQQGQIFCLRDVCQHASHVRKRLSQPNDPALCGQAGTKVTEYVMPCILKSVRHIMWAVGDRRGS